MESQKKALDFGVRVLTMRAVSQKTIYKKIIEKGFSEDDAWYAIERLIEYGALNDEKLAKSWSIALTARGYGKAKIREYLREKGIESEDIAKACEDFEPDYDKMLKYISTKLRGVEADKKTLKKVTDALYRRGFGWDEIKKAIRMYNERRE